MYEKKIAPCFFVGLGGCGGSIVNQIARKVKQDEENYRRYKDLLHFFILDTDQDDVARSTWVDSNHRFVISDFDKPGYVDLKLGKTHRTPDEYFKQWWPEYYRPRSTRGKGAGQIRIESRLSLNYQFENDAGGILAALKAAIARAYDVQNPYRANKAAKIYLYASLAGGTGSGGSALMAAMLRKLLAGRGHQLTGTFVLPNVFRNQGLPLNQFDKVMTNGYAALCEVELLQSAHDRDEFGFVEFHFNPNDHHDKGLTRPLFDQVYVVDAETTAGVVIADPKLVYPSIADAAHAQIFSTILEKEHSTLDNDTRELAALEENGFTKTFGSFGVSALVLPAKDILEYFAVRYAADVMQSAFAGGSAAAVASSDPDAPDKRFVEDLEASARLTGEKGEMARSALEWAGDNSQGALGEYLRWVDEYKEQLGRDLKLPSWKEDDLFALEGQDGVADELNKKWGLLKKRLDEGHNAGAQDVDRTLKIVRGKGAKGSLSDLVDGQGPIRARYFLVKLRTALQERRDAEGQAHEAVKDWTPANVESAFGDFRDRLAKAAPKTIRDLVGSDYKPIVAQFKLWQDGVVQKSNQQVRSRAMVRFYDEAVREITGRLRSVGTLFDRARDIQRMLEERAQRLLRGGGERESGGAANEYVLDVEVFQNHRDGTRYWEHLYRERAPSDAGVASALDEVRRASEGSLTEDEMRGKVIDALTALGKERFRKDVVGGNNGEGGLRIDDGLLFEARTALAIKALTEPGKPPPTLEALAQERQLIPEAAARAYISDKFEFAGGKCKPFVDLYPGGQYLPDKHFATAWGRYRDSLGAYLRAMPSHNVDAQNIIDSDDPHRIVFYTAKLGIALHAIRSVSQYAQRYRVVQADELARGKPWPPPSGPKVGDIPLHIDQRWERAPGEGLFDIDLESLRGPRAKRGWMDKRLTAATSATAAAARDAEMREFVLALVFGQIVRKDETWVVNDEAKPLTLHKFRDRAFEAFVNLPTPSRSWITGQATAALKRLVEDRQFGQLKEKLRRHRDEAATGFRTTEMEEERVQFEQEVEAIAAIAGANRVNLD